MPITTVGIVSAVTPSVIETYVSHYLNRGQLRQKPTAHISYHEGLRLVRQFLDYASKHAVEDLQAFTAQWVPAPTWVKIENVEIGKQHLNHAARLVQDQLGPKGIEQVGGESWWQWRRAGTPLRAEWIEMKKDIAERKHSGGKLDRVMLYVHGGAYYFGSVDEHRYQIQRHARKLKTRVLAPRYRLAPQFPFPCGLQDAIASYLFLLETMKPSQILVAGDSAGGGMVLSMLVILRDQAIPLPAGAMLLSPWVDLTHSFPSVAGDGIGDYIPSHGFHHKPSLVWPPPNAEDLEALNDELAQLKSKQGGMVEKPNTRPSESTNLSIMIDGQTIELKDQIQMYATNALLAHPLVSPVQQPTLGGLPPLLIQVGGAELLHDEQVYLAHKAADPQRYRPSDAVMAQYGLNKDDFTRYDPTYVQLQVWDDLCHVPHTLSFTRPAKYMFRSVAQFGAWALAHAQKKDVEIEDDANSVISSGADTDLDADDAASSTVDLSKSKKRPKTATQDPAKPRKRPTGAVGRAGDPLPSFKDHMIRQRVDRHGITYPLTPAAEMACLRLEPSSIGAIKPGPVRKWLAKKKEMDSRFANEKKKVQRKRVKEMAQGYESFTSGDVPPPTALAGRRRQDMPVEKRAKKSWALALWSGWGSHHDEETIERAENAEQYDLESSSRPATATATKTVTAREDLLSPKSDGRDLPRSSSNSMLSVPRSENHEGRPRSPFRKVSDTGQADEPVRPAAHTPSSKRIMVSPLVTSDEFSSAPEMSTISPDSTKVDGSENTFTTPTSSRPHNNVSAYPFKLRSPMSGAASTATLDDASSVQDRDTPRSTPAPSVAPAESLLAEKEVVVPYYEKEVVAVTAPYPQASELPDSSRPMASQASLLNTRTSPETYSPTLKTNASTASLGTSSPVETYRPQENRPRNPAFDQTGAASTKFSSVDTQPTMGPPKPVGSTYNPRDLRNAMINRSAVESARHAQNAMHMQSAVPTQNAINAQSAEPRPSTSASRQPTLPPLSPTGYIAPVELPVSQPGSTIQDLHRRPSAVTLNPESEPVELSTVKQTRTSMLPPPRTEPPPTPTLELSAVKQTRNSILPDPRIRPRHRPESPTLRPSTMGSNDSGSASSSNEAQETAIRHNVVIPVVEQRRPAPIKAPTKLLDDDVPPTPPPKDAQFVRSPPRTNGITAAPGHQRIGSKPPVLGEVSLGSGLGFPEKMNGTGGSS
ncbi:hypothetical protein AMS68_000924 [Peltaster fructicola]|uniref:Alpha/beta hydrolase fold-3 domain-containing protein n=1 Tax=Peltaster fructicola TaxID=286661 RepID=A0A6H0XKY8_9PEZI|nr:hypothetical protein AMS68_000924 [Peltaster fructicola]